MIAGVIMSPPHRDKDRSGEDTPRAVVVIAVEHRPFQILVEHLAFDFRRLCRLHLGPGLFHDVLVIVLRFLATEAFHLFADGLDELNHHIGERIATF